MRVEKIRVSRFNLAGAIQEINKHVEGRSVHGIFFNPKGLWDGEIEVYTTPIQVHVETIEKPQSKVSKKSKYRGVCWDKGLQKWRVRIMVGGKRISLGVYDDEVEAATVYDLQALKSHGSSAKTNFPKNEYEVKTVNTKNIKKTNFEEVIG